VRGQRTRKYNHRSIIRPSHEIYPLVHPRSKHTNELSHRYGSRHKRAAICHAQKLVPDGQILFAANGTTIATYGYKTLTISLGLDTEYTWRFIIADVDCPIIGADFLHAHHLMVDLRGGKTIDGTSLETISGTLLGANTCTLRIVQFPEHYANLLTTPDDTKTTPTTEHHIITKGPPVHSKVRRLAPDKLHAAKEEFDKLVTLGICRPSSSE